MVLPGVATKIAVRRTATVRPSVATARAGTPGYFNTSDRFSERPTNNRPARAAAPPATVFAKSVHAAKS
jgi:hypothetical protein